MKNKIEEVREYIRKIPKTQMRSPEGRFIVDVNFSKNFEEAIEELAVVFKSLNNEIYQNLHLFSEQICVNAVYNGIRNFYKVIDNYYLGALDYTLDYIDSESYRSMIKVKPTRIFISHSENDENVVRHFVDMLRKQGVKQENLFCSSYQGFGIPLGKNIFDYLRNEFVEYDLFVIFMLSDSYYSSPPCLNEMGAAWVNYNEYQQLLLPGFDFGSLNHHRLKPVGSEGC